MAWHRLRPEQARAATIRVIGGTLYTVITKGRLRLLTIRVARVAACTLALPPIRDTLIDRFSQLRYLHDCSDCFRLERLPGGACTTGKPAFRGAHPERTLTS